jgi:hypothetical protein
MIELTKQSGTRFFVNPQHIAAFEEAGVSQCWHGVRSNVQLTIDKKWHEVRETVSQIAAKISALSEAPC